MLNFKPLEQKTKDKGRKNGNQTIESIFGDCRSEDIYGWGKNR